MNLFLHDVYHGKKILKDGIVPRDLVEGNANYRPEMRGVRVRHGTYVHICGIDIVRDEAGKFCVLEDNGRNPSGVSYVVENRHLMQRAFPDLLDGAAVREVSEYGPRLLNALSEIAPGTGGCRPGRSAVAGHFQFSLLRARVPGPGNGHSPGRGPGPRG